MKGAAGAAAVVALAAGLSALRIPSAYLIAGLLVGATARTWAPVPAPAVSRAAQAIVGAVAAIGVERESLAAIAADWAPLLGVCAATLAMSVGAGGALARCTRLDPVTASLAMIAGGAAGVVSMSRELGADDRVVAVLQYLRVVLAVALTPLIASQLFHASSTSGEVAASALSGLALVAVSATAGIGLSRWLPLAGGELVWSMLAAAALSVVGWRAGIPTLMLDAAFAVIGLQVGVRFTRDTVRRLGSILPAAAALTGVLFAGSLLLGLALAEVADVSRLDAYLATTPGGLPAVVAVAVGAKADVAFILTVQVLRTAVMLAAAAPVARSAARYPHVHDEMRTRL